MDDKNLIRESDNKVSFKKKAVNFLVRFILSVAVVFVLILFLCMIIYTFENDGADLIRRIA